MKTRNALLAYLLIFACAFNGMLSEFLLGHLLSLSWGTVYHQYALTMGLFVCSMGLGAWKLRSPSRPYRRLIQFQILSAGLLMLSALSTWAFLEFAGLEFLPALQLLLILAVGFISGSELPLLEKLEGTGSQTPNVLFFDYLGMAIASLFFGFYLLQRLGVLGTLFVSVSVHAVILTFLFLHRHKAGDPQ